MSSFLPSLLLSVEAFHAPVFQIVDLSFCTLPSAVDPPSCTHHCSYRVQLWFFYLLSLCGSPRPHPWAGALGSFPFYSSGPFTPWLVFCAPGTCICSRSLHPIRPPAVCSVPVLPLSVWSAQAALRSSAGGAAVRAGGAGPVRPRRREVQGLLTSPSRTLP